MTGALVGAGLLLGSVAPAQARPRYDDRGWHHRHDRGNGFGFGDAVGIAALLGAAVVVANSVSKDRKEPRGTDTDNRPYADNDAPPLPAAPTMARMSAGRMPAMPNRHPLRMIFPTSPPPTRAMTS
ncbi:hypothetical protein ACFSUK_22260 [Sphingobium scionense]